MIPRTDLLLTRRPILIANIGSALAKFVVPSIGSTQKVGESVNLFSLELSSPMNSLLA